MSDRCLGTNRLASGGIELHQDSGCTSKNRVRLERSNLRYVRYNVQQDHSESMAIVPNGDKPSISGHGASRQNASLLKRIRTSSSTWLEKLGRFDT